MIDHVAHRGEGHGAGERVAAEGGAVVALGDFGGDLLAGEDGADGEAAAQALGAGHDVRDNAVLLMAVERAGTAHAGLHLVEDEQDARFVAQRAHGLEILGLGGGHAALALHRLQQDRGGLIVDGGLERVQVVVRHLRDALGQQRAVRRLVVVVAGGRDGRQRAAVEGVIRGDDLVAVHALRVEVLAGQLHGALVGLRAGVGEEDAVGKRVRTQQRGQLRLRLNVEDVGRMQHAGVGLGDDRVGDDGMVVAQRVDGDARKQVGVRLAVLVVERAALAAHEARGHALAEDLKEMLAVQRLDFGKIHRKRPPWFE